jgi:hypothetical protein
MKLNNVHTEYTGHLHQGLVIFCSDNSKTQRFTGIMVVAN